MYSYKKKTLLFVVNLIFMLTCSVQVNAESEDTYKSVSPSVLQILILDKTSGTKSSFGSGFFASDNGVVITNFHVISDLVFHPERHRAEYRNFNNESGSLTLLYFDVVNDLAVLSSGGYIGPGLEVAQKTPSNGARVYAMGHPHDLGLSVVEGTYNGLLKNKLIPRIHYTGSLNPGMSGGPALDANDKVVGVNVAAMGDQVSFLVPVKYVQKLIDKAKKNIDVNFKNLVSSQLIKHQKTYLEPILSNKFNEISFGSYKTPGEVSMAFECWGNTRAPDERLYSVASYKCETGDYVYLTADDYTGTIEYRHEYFDTEKLGPQRFYGFLETHFSSIHVSTNAEEKNVTSFICKQGVVDNNKINMKLISCFRGHKIIDGLYDAFLMLTTLEDNDEALYSVLMLAGVSFENGLSFQKRYLDSIVKLEGGE